MPLKNLANTMGAKGFIVVHDENSVIEKLIHHINDDFHAIIKHRDGHFHLEVFKTKRDTKGLYTRDEIVECRNKRDELIHHFNHNCIGVWFNKYGNTKPI